MSSSSSSMFGSSSNNNNGAPVVNRRNAATPTPTLTNAPVRPALENNITENNLGHVIPDGNTRAFYEKNGSLVVLQNDPERNTFEEVQQQPDGSFMVVRIIGPNSSAGTTTPLRQVYTTRTEASRARNSNNLGNVAGGRRRRLRSRRQRTNRRNTRRH